MSPRRVSSIVFPLVGLIVVLAIAFGGEALFESLVQLNYRLFDITLSTIVLPWFAVLMPLLSAAGVILLFWGVMTRSSRPRLIGGIYLIVGFALVAGFILRVYAAKYLGLNPPAPFLLVTVTAPNTFFTNTAGGIAAAGLCILLLPKMAMAVSK
jgi:hypothetical protein